MSVVIYSHLDFGGSENILFDNLARLARSILTGNSAYRVGSFIAELSTFFKILTSTRKWSLKIFVVMKSKS